ncbi:50S ribosomal protein L7/L12 [Enterococcus florum]|uniref:50S ribosomal protein L7/L12 n=1 Tax=Enterococcus florum TaxID=2480627 RepID=A0A4P5P4L8_9ENTE|nr:YlxQ-related RNA-binding protein [Enterococcus florum]GCF92757.1 50S ribosomal protein L7/L12 [Enterococcus florum]
MNRDKALNMLGLAMRAGKLITGEEMTINEIRKNKVKLVIVASDASENTKKKVTDKSKFYQTAYLMDFSESELTNAIGRPRKVIGVMDTGFAERIVSLIKG